MYFIVLTTLTIFILSPLHVGHCLWVQLGFFFGDIPTTEDRGTRRICETLPYSVLNAEQQAAHMVACLDQATGKKYLL